MHAEPAKQNVIPFPSAPPVFHDRPLMLSDLFLIVGIASEAAKEQGVPFEEMLAAVVMDELQLDWKKSP